VDDPFLVSRTTDGEPLHSGGWPSLSADGRLVTYHSIANPTDEANDNLFDIFIYDAECDITIRVPFEHPPEPITEVIYPAMADDGSAVAFASRDENMETLVYVYDLATDEIEIASVDESNTPVLAANEIPSISGDGRFVAFHTDAALVAADTAEIADVYVYDRDTDQIELVSLSAAGEQGTWGSVWPSLSGDGRFVAFESISELVEGINLGPQIYVRDRQEGTTEVVSVADPDTLAGGAVRPSISADGRYVAWSSSASTLVPDDTNGVEDVFVSDRELGTVERVSVTATGEEFSVPASLGEISGNGEVVVMIVGWFGPGQEPVQMWAKNRTTGDLVLLSEGPSGEPGSHNTVNAAISADGKWAAFESSATNLLAQPKPGATWDAYAAAIP
jgi:Tol biopolymer transport system component